MSLANTLNINIFITATDTDAGKTYIAAGLTKSLVSMGKKVAVYKPIAAGCDLIDGELKNEDALLLQAASNNNQTYTEINPITFAEPIAPHIAAQKLNTPINESTIIQGYNALSGEVNIIEGAGGWRLPLGKGRFLSDVIKSVKPKVILVVNMKLGCLNHAVLSYQSILSDGLECIGWIANNQENMPYLDENINELISLINSPYLGTVNLYDSLLSVSKKLIQEI